LKLFYVAGKLTAPTPYKYMKNIEHAKDVSLKLRKKGYAVICPHQNSAHQCGALRKDAEQDFEAWIERDIEILKRCDAIYMLRGWRNSRGAKIEHAKAKEFEKEIYYEENGDILGKK